MNKERHLPEGKGTNINTIKYGFLLVNKNKCEYNLGNILDLFINYINS